MALSRRGFVQAVGIGSATALTGAWIGGAGPRAQHLVGVRTDARSRRAGHDLPEQQRESARPRQDRDEGGTCRVWRGRPHAGPLFERAAATSSTRSPRSRASSPTTSSSVAVRLRSSGRRRTCSPPRISALVGTIPTYEECAGYAEMMGNPVRAVALDADFKMDLGKMADAAKGAGLVFYCNPNNPTATYVGAKATREFLAKVNRESPETTILVDEAYFDYVTDPDHDTHIGLAVENPRVVVARTFSKAYGMAGLRLGYAVGHVDTIKKMREWDGGSGASSLNVLALQAGIAAIEQDASFITAERARNTAARDFTMKWFAERGMKPTDSQANFMFVNIGRPAKEFRDACRAKGVLVARDFPPFEKTHCRLSFGTMDEMKKAVAVFAEVLGKKARDERPRAGTLGRRPAGSTAIR